MAYRQKPNKYLISKGSHTKTRKKSSPTNPWANLQNFMPHKPYCENPTRISFLSIP